MLHPYDYIANRSLVEPEFADLVGTEYAYRTGGVENSLIQSLTQLLTQDHQEIWFLQYVVW